MPEDDLMAKIDFDVKKTEELINKKMEIAVRKIGLDGWQELVRTTPRDTGRARANWSTSVGILPINKGSGNTSINMTEQTSAIKDYNFGQTMYLYNNLEYIMPLEFGNSKQAPEGWIRRTAVKMQKKLDEIKDIL